jgi:hypothetical protein
MYTVPQQVPPVPPSLHHSIRHSSPQHKAGLRKTKFIMSFYFLVRQICVRYRAVYCSSVVVGGSSSTTVRMCIYRFKSAADPKLSFQLSESVGADP